MNGLFQLENCYRIVVTHIAASVVRYNCCDSIVTSRLVNRIHVLMRGWGRVERG